MSLKKRLSKSIACSLVGITIATPILNTVSAMEKDNSKNSLDSKMMYSESYSDEILSEAFSLKQETLPLLNLIEKMPDDVATSGIEEGVKWLNENKTSEFNGYKFIQDGENLTLQKEENSGRRSKRSVDWVACMGAVGTALASNLIPWGKILKVKKAGKLAGSMNKLVKAVSRAYKHQRNLGYSKRSAIKRAVSVSCRSFPSDVKGAAMEFFSLAGLKACFG